MKKNKLPISLCHANCPQCNLPTEFKMFESGPGGDFETYVGANTGSIYRLDLAKLHYEAKVRSELLAEANAKEEKLLCIPNEIQCKICGKVFSATSIPIDGEEFVEAYEL